MIARNKYTAHKAQSAATAAWSDYCAALSAMLPKHEADKIVESTRRRHFARWSRIDAALAKITHRRIIESDIE